jgi:hypothetical protein
MNDDETIQQHFADAEREADTGKLQCRNAVAADLKRMRRAFDLEADDSVEAMPAPAERIDDH